MIINIINKLYDLSDTIEEITISSIGSRYHWIRKTVCEQYIRVEQGFSSTLLGAVFESEI